MQRKCRQCGGGFEVTDPRKVYCSRACHFKWHNARRPTLKNQERACEVCFTLFKPLQVRGPGRRCCSPACERKRAAKYRTPQWRRRDGKRLRSRYELGRRQIHNAHGVTVEQYAVMHAEQRGLCAICKQPETEKSGPRSRVRSLCIDHHHGTGKTRELLCSFCNRGLGQFKDSAQLLRVAAEYLEQHLRNH